VALLQLIQPVARQPVAARLELELGQRWRPRCKDGGRRLMRTRLKATGRGRYFCAVSPEQKYIKKYKRFLYQQKTSTV
jgi:hypothetical protein